MTRHGSEYTFIRPSRTKPQSVIPRSRGKVDGERRRRADRDEIGQPATAAFWTSSNERRPLTHRIVRASGSRSVAVTPSRRPCPSRCGGRRPRGGRAASPRSSKSPVACSPPVAANVAWPSRRRSRQRAEQVGRRNAEVALDARRLDRDRLERALAAHAARRRRVEAPAQRCRIEARRVHVHRVRGQVVGERGRRRPDPFGEAEAERQLLVVARRPHRDRHRLAVDADLERLLDRDLVGLVRAGGEAEHLDPARRCVRAASSWGKRRPEACRAAGDASGTHRCRQPAQCVSASAGDFSIASRVAGGGSPLPARLSEERGDRHALRADARSRPRGTSPRSAWPTRDRPIRRPRARPRRRARRRPSGSRPREKIAASVQNGTPITSVSPA